tara:strand:- start:867 stop:1310 length:444 start_codon:yes stop_codon:yes gene_type:complete
MNEPINKYFILEHLENTLSQLSYYYVPSKSNKIIVKKFFHSLPFFFFNVEIQNKLYKIIQNYQITSYIDSNQSMKQLCYNIYKDFSIQLRLKSKTKYDFFNDLMLNLHNEETKIKKIKQKNIHSYLFFLFIIGIIIGYYFIQKKINE